MSPIDSNITQKNLNTFLDDVGEKDGKGTDTKNLNASLNMVNAAIKAAQQETQIARIFDDHDAGDLTDVGNDATMRESDTPETGGQAAKDSGGWNDPAGVNETPGSDTSGDGLAEDDIY